MFTHEDTLDHIKVCATCHQPTDEDDFYPGDESCTFCVGIDITEIRTVSYYMSHEDMLKEDARSANRAAVADGSVSKPTICEHCGTPDEKLQGHHHNGYEPDHWLDVLWLCSRCHHNDHKRMRAIKNTP